MAREPDHDDLFAGAGAHVTIGVACGLVLGIAGSFALDVPVLWMYGILIGAIAGMAAYGLLR